ncbi:MAG: hypothetical protein IKA88_02840, partial [Clostridia bacterium]|nr:hypothetical protein [Clostridia bacterium]
MRKIRKSIVACLCATVGLGAIGLGVTLGNVSSSGNGSTAVENDVLAYYIDGDAASTAVYGTHTNATNVTGVVATTAPKDKLVMREVVNLNDLSVTKPLISVIPAPTAIGAADCAKLKIDIVDAYDETNYVTAMITPYNSRLNYTDVGYIKAYASNGQLPTGKDRGGSTIHVDNYWGHWVHFKFYGVEGDASKNSFGISYDNETNALYAVRGNDGGYELVADLDDPAYFGTNLFKGFKTGEVYCRVYAEDFEKENARFIVKSYADNDLSAKVISDETGPKIDLDFGEYTAQNYPNALVGFDYPLFGAKAFDTYTGSANVSVKVYMNYFSASKMEMPVKKGNLFQPQIAGTYHAVYFATDEHGNTSEQVVEIKAINKTANELLKISLSDYEEQTVIGALYNAPAAQISGELGNYKLTVTAKNGTIDLPVENGEEGYYVRPMQTGTMTVTYTATDYVGQTATQTINVTVNATTKPTFIETPVLPIAMIEGSSYTLPKVNAYNFIDGSGAPVATTIKVKAKGATEATALTSNKYVPTVDKSGDEVEIIYEAKIGGAVETWSKKVPVMKVRTEAGLDMSKYFSFDSGASINPTSTSLEMISTDFGVFQYLVAQSATSFTMDFTASATTKNATRISIALFDYYDMSNAIMFNYVQEAGSVYFYVNDNQADKLKISGTFAEKTLYNIDYDNKTATVKYDVSNNRTMTVTKNVNGDEFNGFAGNKYYVAMNIDNVDGKTASIYLTKINGNPFSNAIGDYSKPMISINGDFGGELALNDVFVLPEALVFDVLDGEVDAYLTVTAPSGEIVTSVEGIKLEDWLVDNSQTISVKCSEYGTYFVTYNAKDNSNRKLNYSYTLRIIDGVAPTVTPETDYPDTVT